MAEVRILSSITVLPAGEAKSPPTEVRLTLWDLQLLLLGPIQKGLLFHNPPDSSLFIYRLKASLSRALDFFPPVAGRIAATLNEDGSTSFSVRCNGAGVEFVHAVADGLSVADILHSAYVPGAVHSFFPLNGVLNHEGDNKPLLGVQVTMLSDGLFVGVTMNHSLGDGTTFWHFINSWSELSRGSESISKLPDFTRRILDAVELPIRIPNWEEKLRIKDSFVVPPYAERVFHFSQQSISNLKSKANVEIGTNLISSLQSVLAHLWRCVSRNRPIDDDVVLPLTVIVGARPRWKSALPEGYFGNAVQFAVATATAGELRGKGLGWAAWRINELVREQTAERVRDYYERLMKEPKVPRLGEVLTNALLISSSPKFDMYGNDFGWGKPVAVRSGNSNKSEGKMTLFAGEEEGSVEIEACLSPETLQAIEKDDEFMDAVTMLYS